MDRPASTRFVLLTVLIDMVSIGIIVPVMPVLIGDFTANLAEQAFWYGILLFSYGIANFFALPVMGALSDRYGRRPILLLGLCGMACSFFVTALATQLWILVAVRILSGTLMANMSVARAYVADVTTPEDRGRRFGELSAMGGLGYILGPALGGTLGPIDIRLPFFVAGSLALINLLYGYYVLPESLPPERRRAVSLRSANTLASLIKLRELKSVEGLIGVVALSSLAQFVLLSTWVLYMGFRFHWGPRESGWSLFVFGIMSVFAQSVVLRRLLPILGAPRMAMIGLISSAICLTLYGLATAGWMIYVLIPCNVLAFTVAPAVQSIISRAAPPTMQGQIMGSVAALHSLASVFAPTVSAALLGFVSHLLPGDWRVGAPFFFCAALQFASMLIALAYVRRRAASPGGADELAGELK